MSPQRLYKGVMAHLLTSQVCFMLALFIFEIGSLISGVATSSNIFIVGRTVAGMGGAGILNGALTIISASAPLHRRPGNPKSDIISTLISNFYDSYYRNTTWMQFYWTRHRSHHRRSVHGLRWMALVYV